MNLLTLLQASTIDVQANNTAETTGFDLSAINLQWFAENAVDIVLNILGALAIVIIGFWLANKFAHFFKARLDSTDLSISLKSFLQSLIGTMIKILVIIVAMNTMGVATTSFVALLGGIAVGIGLALQGSLQNLAGGLLILLFKPFEVGDYIESLDKMGTVQKISILQTVLLTPDMRSVILPNGEVFNNPIENYSNYGVRRVDIKVGIGYNDDFEEVKPVLEQVLKNEPLMIDDHEYVIEILGFGDSSVDLALYGYCKTENYLKAKYSLNLAVKKALDANGFSIPYPQRDLHVIDIPNRKS